MELAMDSVKDKYDFHVRWEPFFLKPNTPPEGIPKPAAYTDPNNPRVAALIQSGAEIGLQFTNKCPVFPNTLKAHALMEYSKEVENGQKQNDVAEKLFKKYFTDGEKLADETLLEVVSDAGLSKDSFLDYVTNSDNLEKVVTKAARWSAKGISGVPTFYMNGQKMFSGAQDPHTFTKMFEVAATRFPLQPESKN